MTDAKSTKLNIREDRPTGIASSIHGSNLNAVGFNLQFLALRNPRLAIEVLKLYARAYDIQEGDPQAPDEDFELFTEALKNLPADSENQA